MNGKPQIYRLGAGKTEKSQSLREELFAIHDIAASHFHRAFHARDDTGNFMREYWVKQRKFDLSLADEFQIGAARADGGNLFALLQERQFSENALRKCGLFSMHRHKGSTKAAVKPCFRGRLLIPIHDNEGRTMAFTAQRTALTPENNRARDAEYNRTPEISDFTDYDLLFNLDRARNHLKHGDPFVMVKDVLDAIRCWRIGIKTAVASVTEEGMKPSIRLYANLVSMRRYADKIECLFVNDDEGENIAMPFLRGALHYGFEARFLLRSGKAKPDLEQLFFERGKTAYEELQAGAQSAMAFACSYYLPDAVNAGPKEKLRAMEQLIKTVSRVEPEDLRSLHIEEAAKHLCLPPRLLHATLARRVREHHEQHNEAMSFYIKKYGKETT